MVVAAPWKKIDPTITPEVRYSTLYLNIFFFVDASLKVVEFNIDNNIVTDEAMRIK